MTTDENLQVEEHVVQQLAETAGVMTHMLERMLETHEVQSKDIEYFRADLVLVRDAIAKIAKILHEGNGQKPLITRVAVLETQAEYLLEQAKERAESKATSTKGKYALAVAVVTGVCALAAQVISAIW